MLAPFAQVTTASYPPPFLSVLRGLCSCNSQPHFPVRTNGKRAFFRPMNSRVPQLCFPESARPSSSALSSSPRSPPPFLIDLSPPLVQASPPLSPRFLHATSALAERSQPPPPPFCERRPPSRRARPLPFLAQQILSFFSFFVSGPPWFTLSELSQLPERLPNFLPSGSSG